MQVQFWIDERRELGQWSKLIKTKTKWSLLTKQGEK